MVRVVSSLLLLLLIWAPSDVVPTTLRVLTYNIHHGEGRDGRFDLSRVADVITTARADLVALQEVDQGTERASGVHQLAELERLTGMHSAFGKAMDYEGGGYGVGVLSRWSFSSTARHSLPGAPDREPRLALTVQLRAGEGGPLLQFTSTHLDQGRDSENRLAQARHLNEVLVRDERQPTVLAGDMNARPDTEVMAILTARWTNSASEPSPTGLQGRRGPRGDYVLYRPVEGWRVVESTLIDETLASDHRPILVVLEWAGQR